MNEKQVSKLLADIGAVVTGSHLIYTSGKHGSAYVNKDAIYPHTSLTSDLCLQLAKHFLPHGPEVVVAPVIGGVILSQWVAYHLSSLMKTEVLGVYAEKQPQGDGFVLKRGYDKLVHGKKILVVEDILNTGGSVKKVVEAVRLQNGQILGVGALCNRGGVHPKDLGDVPEIFSILNIQLEAWDQPECPLCKQGVPVNQELGKGKTK